MAMANTLDPVEVERYLDDYYRSLYPVDLICKWLSYNKDAHQYFALREFVFILKDEIHMRYLSFKNVAELIEKLQRTSPAKIDIGAVYNQPPCDRKKVSEFMAMERELVFDIDLTDYDSIRSCCSGTSVCSKCWRFIVIAVKVLERLLRGHFGFRHMLWVFSGRRGVHCWVADEKARKLPNRGREALAKYLSYDKSSSAISKYRVHPMAEHSYRTIMDSGEMDKLVFEQKWLEGEVQWTPILKFCDDPKMRDVLHKEFLKYHFIQFLIYFPIIIKFGLESPDLRWRLLKLRFDKKEREIVGREQKLPNPPSEAAKNFLKIFVLSYAYPKLDEKVTTSLNHLLKCPFSIHPKNGNVAVPISAKTVDRFQLDQVPRVDKLCVEMSKINKTDEAGNKENRRQMYYNQSSLAPYIEVFDAFVKDLCSK
uniref:DNA primase n=1 Tax=Ditylenchus dipsaci TaxID=166011 RepID=A0A915E623_9BILA